MLSHFSLWIEFRSYIYQYYKPVLCLFRRNTSFVCLICFQLITISLIYPFWGTGLNIYDLATWKNAPCMIGYAQKLLSKFSIWFKATTRTRTSRKNCRFVYKFLCINVSFHWFWQLLVPFFQCYYKKLIGLYLLACTIIVLCFTGFDNVM